jgi:tellurite resistance protein TerC
LSVILAFIGIKLVLHALHEYHLADWAPFGGEIPIWLSLTVIIVTLLVTTVASLVKSRWDDDNSPSSSAASDSESADAQAEPAEESS